MHGILPGLLNVPVTNLLDVPVCAAWLKQELYPTALTDAKQALLSQLDGNLNFPFRLERLDIRVGEIALVPCVERSALGIIPVIKGHTVLDAPSG